jgi:hypothetical protein
VHHCTQPLAEMGPHELFAGLGSNCDPPNLSVIPSSWDYRRELPMPTFPCVPCRAHSANYVYTNISQNVFCEFSLLLTGSK